MKFFLKSLPSSLTVSAPAVQVPDTLNSYVSLTSPTEALACRGAKKTADTASLVALLCDLVKIRLTSLVLLTTVAGFYLGNRGQVNYWLMLEAILGTALVAFGAAALNQCWECQYDGQMRRTMERPLPSGRMQPGTAILFGVACAVTGLMLLALMVNWLAFTLGAITLAVYLFVYTPLKRITWFNTMVGAVPGALPPLIGWAASQNHLDKTAWTLFGIIFFWQIAHFLAIAWLYREDYAQAGFVMLPVVDPSGALTGPVTVAHCLGLLAVSVLPFTFGLGGTLYLSGALLLGLAFLGLCLQFARHLTLRHARWAFLGSIIYLPLLFGLLVLDKVGP